MCFGTTMKHVYIFFILYMSKQVFGQCQTSYSDMAIDGNDLISQPGSVSSCCAICQQRNNCAAFTWNNTNGGTCWLKNDTQPLYKLSGAFTVMLAPSSDKMYSLNTSYEGANFFDNFKFQLGSADCGCFVNYTDRNTSESLGLIKIENNKVSSCFHFVILDFHAR